MIGGVYRWRNLNVLTRRRHSRPVKVVLVAVVTVAWGPWSCPIIAELDSCTESVQNIQVGAVTIASGRVQVAPGESFELRALVWGEDGSLLPEFLRDPSDGSLDWDVQATVTWSLEDASGNSNPLDSPIQLDETGPGSHRVIVTAASYPGSLRRSSSAYIVAEAAGNVAKREIEILVPDVALLTDAVTSAREFKSTPTIGLFDSGAGPSMGCMRKHQPLQFVLAGRLGQLEPVGDACAGQYSLFNQGRRAVLHYRPRGGPVLPVRFRSSPIPQQPAVIRQLIMSSPPPSDTLGVVVWLPEVGTDGGTTSTTAIAEIESQVSTEFEIANTLMRENRVGLQFRVLDTQWVNVSDWSSLGVGDSAEEFCSGEVRSALEPHVGAYKDHKVVHVFYFYGVGPFEAATNSRPMGHSCLDVNQTMSRIFLFLESRAPTTLAHELGHQLFGTTHFGDDPSEEGPFFPTVSECGYEDEDARHNLMSSGFSGNFASSRHHLTIGQVFRGNFDRKSFVLDGEAYPVLTDVSNANDIRSDLEVPFWCDDDEPGCPPVILDPGWLP